MYYCSIFQQLFKFIPRYRFDKMVEEASGNRCCRHFSARRQFLTCLYAQITGKDSLREVAGDLMTNRRTFGVTVNPEPKPRTKSPD